MPYTNTTLVYQWFDEVWNNAQEDSVSKLLDEQAIIHDLSGPDPERGINGFKKFYDSFRSEYPDVHIDVQEVVSQENFEAGLCTVNATHKNGTKVKFDGMFLVKKDNGKIVEGWNQFDFLGMYRQLGYDLAPKAAVVAE